MSVLVVKSKIFKLLLSTGVNVDLFAFVCDTWFLNEHMFRCILLGHNNFLLVERFKDVSVRYGHPLVSDLVQGSPSEIVQLSVGFVKLGRRH